MGNNISAKQAMPVLFIGHGSPMNAIQENNFTRSLGVLGAKLPRPRAIVCISAHWLTKGTWVTHMTSPKTIHDFYGFPKELYNIQYQASGDPPLAEMIHERLRVPPIQLDENWGLDHGTWAVLRHLFPEADIPTIQVSLDRSHVGNEHYQLGEQLRFLRDQEILIVGSGNLVHNLSKIDWETEAKPFDWAVEFDQWVKNKLLAHEYNELVSGYTSTQAGRLSVPTPDHYFPFLVALGAKKESDTISFEYEGIQNGSISMRTIGFGLN